MKTLQFEENGLFLEYDILDDGRIKFRHFSNRPLDRNDFHPQNDDGWCPVEIQIPGADRPLERMGNKYIVTYPGYLMKYYAHTDERNEIGRRITLIMREETSGIEVSMAMQFYDGLSCMRIFNTVTNLSDKNRILEHVSCFNYLGIDKEGKLDQDEKLRVYVPHNGWQKEICWQTYTLPELGMPATQKINDRKSSKRLRVSNTGNWSTKEYLPMGMLENCEIGNITFWQIEHNGSWKWELSDQSAHVYIQLAGPSEIEDHWNTVLKPGESFETVPVCVGVVNGSFDEASRELTKYRRKIRRENKDDRELPVIFNDYMNCLWGDPTTEKELPMIEAAAKAGCEIYVIDCGWYSPGYWWDNVGEWKESRERFPNGMKEVTDSIIAHGMVPGVWLEIEVMGIKCPIAEEFADGGYFMRHGERVYDRSRYQLDFRNQKVRDHATAVIDRLVADYGVGYIKMDYNIEPGIGTELDACSPGEGLLLHNRAYLSWLDSIFEKYPDLVIENCSSGGQRIDYAMLSRYSIQSTSDTDDFRMYATIAANSPSALTPEQSAIWSYPLTGAEDEIVIFNMVNCMLLRMHQSGHLVNMAGTQFDLIQEGISVYKEYREKIAKALPFWPIGFAGYHDTFIAMGLETEKDALLALWRREGTEDTIVLPMPQFKNRNVQVNCIYPEKHPVPYCWDEENGTLTVTLSETLMARLFEITFGE